MTFQDGDLRYDYEDPEELFDDEDPEFNRVIALYIKAILGNQQAIKELDQIAKSRGQTDHLELMEYLDWYLINSEAWGDRESPIMWAATEEYFKEHPGIAYIFAINYMYKDRFILREIFGDPKEWGNEKDDHFASNKFEPIPKMPSTKAKLSDWFNYYHEREKLGFPITLGEIANMTNYSEKYLRRLHMNYNYSRDKDENKE